MFAGGYGGGFAGGFRGPRPINPYYMGTTVVGLSFIQLILGLLLLAAQIGLYYYCQWNNHCLILPAFVPCILMLIASMVGIASGVERTNTLISTNVLLGFLVLLGTPVSMGVWAVPEYRILPFSLVPATGVDDTLAAIYWGLVFLPVINWILFMVTVGLGMMALCCPSMPMGGDPYGGPYGGYPPRPRPPAPVYDGLPWGIRRIQPI